MNGLAVHRASSSAANTYASFNSRHLYDKVYREISPQILVFEAVAVGLRSAGHFWTAPRLSFCENICTWAPFLAENREFSLAGDVLNQRVAVWTKCD